MPRSITVRLAAAAALLAAAPGARAAPFDPATGTISLEGASLAWSVDSLAELPTALALEAKDADQQPVETSTVSAWFSKPPTQAIEGRGALWMGRRVDRIDLSFAQADRLAGRRVEIRLWQQPNGVELNARLAWTAGDWVVGLLRFQPTGRRTDDGWVELSSGPFDFALGGRIVPELAVRVTRGSAYGTIREKADGYVALDALEVADLGPSAVPAERCTLATEAAVCGELGLCHFGRCVDQASVLGRLPAEGLREEYVDRRSFEVRHFNGNRVGERTFEAFREQLSLARAATTPRGYWAAIDLAYQKLGDGHGSGPTAGYSERPGIGMCVHLGDADRLPAQDDGSTPRLPLLFYAAPGSAVSAGLLPGDALATVDGMPVDDWKALAGGRLAHHGSPLAREVTIAPSIPALAMRTGSRLGFLRCPAAIAETRRCAEEELEQVEVDLYSFGGEGLWSGDVSAWTSDGFGCDFRFRRLSGDEPRAEYLHAAAEDDGEVRVVQFNGVPDPSWSPSWVDTVRTALQPTSSRFLYDERTGYGGVFPAVDLLAAPFLDPRAPAIAEIFPVLGRELDEESRWTFLECARGASLGSLVRTCGNYFGYSSGSSWGALSGTLRDAKVALLVAHDVSGNDYLTRILKFRPTLTRIFGSCPTFGAFGSVYDMASYLGEMAGGTAQLGDSLVYQGEGPVDFRFESGPGVRPHEIVFQTQSDLVAGRDTLVERAKAWLRETPSEEP